MQVSTKGHHQDQRICIHAAHYVSHLLMIGVGEKHIANWRFQLPFSNQDKTTLSFFFLKNISNQNDMLLNDKTIHHRSD